MIHTWEPVVVSERPRVFRDLSGGFRALTGDASVPVRWSPSWPETWAWFSQPALALVADRHPDSGELRCFRLQPNGGL